MNMFYFNVAQLVLNLSSCCHLIMEIMEIMKVHPTDFGVKAFPAKGDAENYHQHNDRVTSPSCRPS